MHSKSLQLPFWLLFNQDTESLEYVSSFDLSIINIERSFVMFITLKLIYPNLKSYMSSDAQVHAN